jgi:hypothetical protein
VLVRRWRKENPSDGGNLISILIMENSMVVPLNIKNRIAILSSNLIAGHVSKRSEISVEKASVPPNSL